jgi:flagellar FliJ protein
MSALRSFYLAIEVATRRRDDAGRLLLQARRALRSAEDQMEQLESYAADTMSKWGVGGQTSTAPEIMGHYDQFMARLQQAIDLQRLAVADLEREALAARNGVRSAEIRIAGLNQMLQKKQSAQLKQLARREQKDQDEFAALQYRKSRAEFDAQETV